MATGDPFTKAERFALDDAVRSAEQRSRMEFSVFVGNASGDPRAFATSLHNTLVVPARSILIMLDPTRRVLEVVTGGQARARVSDAEVEAVVAAMTERFAGDDLLGGLLYGVHRLADHLAQH